MSLARLVRDAHVFHGNAFVRRRGQHGHEVANVELIEPRRGRQRVQEGRAGVAVVLHGERHRKVFRLQTDFRGRDVEQQLRLVENEYRVLEETLFVEPDEPVVRAPGRE